MKTLRTVIITIVVLLVILGVAGWLVKRRQTQSQPPTQVRVELPQKGELVEFVSATGDVKARRQVSITPKVSARIAQIPYREGEIVTAGDPNANPPIPASVLVRLDDADLRERLRSVEAGYKAALAGYEVQKEGIESKKAQLESLRVTLQQAQRDLERQEILLVSRDISLSDVDKQRTLVAEKQNQLISAGHDLEQAQRQMIVTKFHIEQADAEVGRARDDLSYTTIHSPINGVVTKVFKVVGEVVTGASSYQGTTIMEVADLAEVLAVVNINEADIDKVRVGQKATVRMLAFGEREFEGLVESVALSNRNDQSDMSRNRMGSSGGFKAEVLLKSSEARFLVGLTADAEIHVKKHEGILTVPSQAVLARPTDGLPMEIRQDNPLVNTAKSTAIVVFRLINGEAIITPVKIGASNATRTVIEAGLGEQDTVVVGPYKVLEGLQHKQKIVDEREANKDKKGDPNKPAPAADPNAPQPEPNK